MKFLYPTFLFALFTLLIPILIHLFSFRRYTTVYFSNVSYLKNIKKESTKKSRLRNLLLLASRILAVVCLVFTFAQPYLPSGDQDNRLTGRDVAVYIDNSFSMNGQSAEGQLLEAARNKAVEIVSAFPEGTRFRLVTNDMNPAHRHLFNKEQFITQVSETGLSARSLPLSAIHNLLANPGSYGVKNEAVTLFYLSDFQTGSVDFKNFVPDSTLSAYLLPLTPANTGNLYIDSCWMDFPAHKVGQEERLKVRIANTSEDAYQNLPVKFFLNDSLKAIGNFNIESGGEEVVELKYVNLRSGFQTGHAEITDFPIVHDNTFFLSYKVEPYLRALAITDNLGNGKTGLLYLRALFGNDDYIRYEESQAGSLQVSGLSQYNTIFLLNLRQISSGLINELKKSMSNGTTVVFFPDYEGHIESYNNFLGVMNANRILGLDTTRREISGIEWTHPVFDQVFSNTSDETEFPMIRGNFVFSEDVRIPEARLLWFRNGAKAVSIQASGDGNLAVFSFPLSARNEEFARDILFVPALYGLAINSLPRQKVAYSIGNDLFASLLRQHTSGPLSVTVSASETEKEFIPEVTSGEGNRFRIHLSDFFASAGHYLVKSNDGMLATLSMNHNRKESLTKFSGVPELKSEIEKYNLKQYHVIAGEERNFTEIFKEIQNGKKLWQWFLALALLFLAAEALIVRFVK